MFTIDLASASDADLQDYDRMVILFAAHYRRAPDFVMALEADILRELHRRGWIEITDGSTEDIVSARMNRLYPDDLPSDNEWHSERSTRAGH